MEEDQLFKAVKNKTGVDKKQIFDLVNSLQGANLRDEKTVRQLIQDVARIANKPVPKEKEERLVKAITSNNIPDFSVIFQVLGGK
ncbi:MAG TPA: stage VI sporulation protein F [Bacillales bacterium]|nr:stage VI sporulation protein F [Bacillales bacterium]